MARTWSTIRVELLSGIYAECDPAPGRVFLVGPQHTLQQLARAINVGFARWDHSHLYEFELADGNTVGFSDMELGQEDVLDHATTKVLDRVGPGDRFGYRYGRVTDGRDDASLTEPEIPFPFLHDELVRIIEINGGEPMTSADLADTINAGGRYLKKDGSAMTSSQISARVSKYPQLFERADDGRIALRRERRG